MVPSEFSSQMSLVVLETALKLLDGRIIKRDDTFVLEYGTGYSSNFTSAPNEGLKGLAAIIVSLG